MLYALILTQRVLALTQRMLYALILTQRVLALTHWRILAICINTNTEDAICINTVLALTHRGY